jgi:hypothetical protein
MGETVEVLGVISLIVMVVAFFSGIFMKRKTKIFFKIHRVFGIIAFALAISHGILAMID